MNVVDGWGHGRYKDPMIFNGAPEAVMVGTTEAKASSESRIGGLLGWGSEFMTMQHDWIKKKSKRWIFA